MALSQVHITLSSSWQQKLQLLKATLAEEDSSRCTFQPSINNSYKANIKSDKPVHERLSEAGRAYKDRIAERAEQQKLYDSEGRRLFQPHIPRHPIDEDNSGLIPCFYDHSIQFVYMKPEVPETRSQQMSICIGTLAIVKCECSSVFWNQTMK